MKFKLRTKKKMFKVSAHAVGKRRLEESVAEICEAVGAREEASRWKTDKGAEASPGTVDGCGSLDVGNSFEPLSGNSLINHPPLLMPEIA